MNWFYNKDGSATGPVDEQQIVQLVKAGAIQMETLVWNDTMPGWKPVAETDLSKIFAHSSPPPFPTEIKNTERRLGLWGKGVWGGILFIGGIILLVLFFMVRFRIGVLGAIIIVAILGVGSLFDDNNGKSQKKK